jgi:hypothetical protein
MQLVEEEHHTYTDGPPPSLGSPVSLPGSDYYVPPSPGSPTGSRLSVGSMPLAGSPSPRPPPWPYPSQPGPSEDHFPNPPGFSVNPDTLPSTSNQPTPQTPDPDPEIHSLLHEEHFPTELWDKVLKGKIRRRISGPGTVNSAQRDPLARSTNTPT